MCCDDDTLSVFGHLLELLPYLLAQFRVNATVGSSNMINSGSANNVIAKDNRRFMPPENCATFYLTLALNSLERYVFNIIF